jgi:hypothetical protein
LQTCFADAGFEEAWIFWKPGFLDLGFLDLGFLKLGGE